MRTGLILAACLFSAAVFAGDAPDNAPRSTAAKSAIIKADRAEQQAEAAYKRAMSEIYRKLVLELADARAAVMRDGGPDALKEATRIQAVIDATNQKLAGLDGSAKAGIAKDVAGTVWRFKGTGSPLTYATDGTVECGDWGNAQGRWTPVAPQTIQQTEPGGAVVEITFDSSVTHALWVYRTSGQVAYAVRVKR